jgi:hypothetical protein
MKRLRHPIRAIREPFGTAGLIVACVALVLALTGAAFAAAGLSGKQKKEVEKIAKKYAGKPGAPGAEGPAGAAGKDGTIGEKGAKGDTGAPGSPGTPGTPGAAGKSPEIVAEGPTLCSGKGGVVYEVEGSNDEAEICNGKEGKDGSLWTAGGTLPPGATETGYWSFQAPPEKIKVDVEGSTQEIQLWSLGTYAPVSFPIPFPFNIKESHTHFLTSEQAFLLKEGLIHGGAGELCEGKTGGELTACEAEQGALHASCSGTFIAPVAAPGELCVYANEATTSLVGIKRSPEGVNGARKFGAILQFEPKASYAEGWGSFAVTGCKEKPGESECE